MKRPLPRLVRRAASILALFAALVPAAFAADGTMLIQSASDGRFKVWQSEGESQLTERELLILEGTARPEGSAPLTTRFGVARAFDTPDGIVVELPEARRDRALLLDHDACSAIKAWHAGDGAGEFTDDQLADIFLSAAPEGGRNIQVGGRLVKAFSTRIGVKAVYWTPLKKK
jgi:hypothetical protein